MRVDARPTVIKMHELRADAVDRALEEEREVRVLVSVWGHRVARLTHDDASGTLMPVIRERRAMSTCGGMFPAYVRCQKRERQRKSPDGSSPSSNCVASRIAPTRANIEREDDV